MKKLSVKVFDDICKADVPQLALANYSCGDYDITVEINPVLSMAEKQEFIEAVWAIYYAPDKDGNWDFRTYALEPAIRLLTLYFHCPNLKIDLSKDLGEYYNFLINTGFYEELCKRLPGQEQLVRELNEYIERKVREQENAMAFAAKSQLDSLLETVLTKLATALDKVAADGVDIKDLIAAIGTAKELGEQDKLVSKILDYRFGKEGGENGGKHSGEDSTVGIGSSED